MSNQLLNGQINNLHLGVNYCNVPIEHWTNILEVCRCTKFDDRICQLEMKSDIISCKLEADNDCRDSVKFVASLYRKAGINDPRCRNEDENYKTSQESGPTCSIGIFYIL